MFISVNLYSQTDNNPYINTSEAEYLNKLFNENLNGFCFRNKKVGFVKYGEYKSKIILSPVCKQSFFRIDENTLTTHKSLSYKNTHYFKLLLLPDKEKVNSGGYDAFVISYDYYGRKKSKDPIIISEVNHQNLITTFFEIEQSLPNNQYDVLGTDNQTLLNDAEARFLDKKYSTNDDLLTFDFKGKRIAFFINTPSRILTKNEYFNEKKRCINNRGSVQSQVVLLTDEQKNKTGGYDAIIVPWRKMSLKDDYKRIQGFIDELELQKTLSTGHPTEKRKMN